MNQTLRWSTVTAALLLPLGPGGAEAQQADAENMTFFLTSAGPGNGADLGGLEGADAHCQQLAEAAGAGGRTWRAYLSTQADGGRRSTPAIASGPARGRTQRAW